MYVCTVLNMYFACVLLSLSLCPSSSLCLSSNTASIQYYTCQHIWSCINIITYTQANKHTHAHTCTTKHTHMHIHAHTCTYMHTHTHAHTCKHMHISKHTHAHTCTHKQSHTHALVLLEKVFKNKTAAPRSAGAHGRRSWKSERSSNERK